MHVYMNTYTLHKVPMFLDHKINEAICFVGLYTCYTQHGTKIMVSVQHMRVGTMVGGVGEGEDNGSF